MNLKKKETKVKFYKAWVLQDFWKGTNKPTSFNKLKNYKKKKVEGWTPTLDLWVFQNLHKAKGGK